MSTTQRALEGIRVIDMTRVFAGPISAQILGDLGADVIKVERPGSGDEGRGYGLASVEGKDGKDLRQSGFFTASNRNKRSITVNHSKPEGQDILRALVKTADILIENYKVGDLKRFGLDYESLKAINPRLIYCSITGFGQTGPMAARAGYDGLFQASGGMMAVTGIPEGQPGAGPVKAGPSLVDFVTGHNSAIAILAALNHRNNTGEGQYIDMALLDVQVACLANQAGNYLATGHSPQRLGNAHPNIVPYQDFPTADGYMILAIGNDGQFARFCAAAGAPQLATDERFATNRARVVNRTTLIPLLKKLTIERSTAEWIATLEALAVPCGPINTLADVFADPQVQARGLKVTMPHPVAGQVPLVASPMKLSATPVDYRLPPPMLGEHTDEILAATLGLDAAAIARLRADGVV